MENNIQSENEPFYYNERVDVILPKDGRVMDAQIVSIRGNILIVKYTDTNFEENIHLDDNLILKQWRPGRQFKRYNRIDIKNSQNNKWNEGVILDIDPDKILIRYKDPGEGKFIEQWIHKDSKDIAQAGKYSGRFNPSLHTPEEINSYLYRKKKFYKTNENQEKKFRDEIKIVGLKIREIKGDGNCMYRAVADQVYGAENCFDIVKSKCLDYLELEKEFFSKFIDGGMDRFNEYLTMKKMDGVWGDDIELQCLSEMYNRPIEIYSHSKEPLKTFHESSGSETRGYEREKSNTYPIRLSYHGRAHYNSLVPEQNYSIFKTYLQTTLPGEYENNVLEKVKTKIMQEKAKLEDNNIISDFNKNLYVDKNLDDTNKIFIDIHSKHEIGNDKVKLEISRENFMEKRLKDLDLLLEENLNNPSGKNSPKNTTDNNGNNINEAMKQSENFATELDMINSVLELSKNEVKEGSDLTNHPSIKFILEMGFTLEDAVLAYSAVGEDPDHMLQYLYSYNL